MCIRDSNSTGHLGQSIYLREVEGREDGAPPTVDLEAERTVGDLVRTQIQNGLITSCHDISDGGLLVACCEMALASNMGIVFSNFDSSIPVHAKLFGEEQGRYIVTCNNKDKLLHAAKQADITLEVIGITGGSAIKIEGEEIELSELRVIHESWLPNYMN